MGWECGIGNVVFWDEECGMWYEVRGILNLSHPSLPKGKELNCVQITSFHPKVDLLIKCPLLDFFKFGIWNLEFGVWSLEFVIWNLRFNPLTLNNRL